MKMMMISTIILAMAAICLAAFFVFWFRQQMKNEMNLLLNRLDRAIEGKMEGTDLDESLQAAIGERLNRLVEIQKAHLEETEEERDKVKTLISDISHQVRTPLTNIMLYTDLLREHPLTEAEDKMAAQIQKQAGKLDFFMKELVKTSYTEAELIRLSPEMSSVDELICMSLQAAELSAMKKNIRLEYKEELAYQSKDREIGRNQSCPGDLCACFDKKWTQEALGNLIENAIKYSPSESTIRIHVIPYESFVCIQVKDRGIGIEEKEQGLIFQRFYRSARVKEEAGLGIGLYLTREIAKKEGGYVKVDSALGKGSVFSLFLPRYAFFEKSKTVKTVTFEKEPGKISLLF